MALDQKDIELIQEIIYKNADDIAVSISRSFERLEERIDEAESRLHSRLREIEEGINTLIPGKGRLKGDVEDAINELDGFGKAGDEERLPEEID